ncbi:MAG: hypothetical protein ACR2K3_02935 [Nocardioides sp.]
MPKPWDWSLATAEGPADFSISRLEQALRGFGSVGIGRRELAPELEFDIRGGLELLNEEVEQSPSPSTEWDSMANILGIELLAALCGLHESSIRRYLKKDRKTPDRIAWRLHFLAMVCADLLTGYNHFGARRWFERMRTALGGQAPRDLLTADWDPDDEGPQAVARLAVGLVTMNGT